MPTALIRPMMTPKIDPMKTRCAPRSRPCVARCPCLGRAQSPKSAATEAKHIDFSRQAVCLGERACVCYACSEGLSSRAGLECCWGFSPGDTHDINAEATFPPQCTAMAHTTFPPEMVNQVRPMAYQT